MQEIEIKKVKVKDNVRQDYGNLDELTASIKEAGVRIPIVISDDNELIDGHRRLKAAIAAGIDKIPYVISKDQLDKKTEQLIAGMLQKNLNSFEEGKAFGDLIKDKKISAKTLATKLGKNEEYVNRRLYLNSCIPAVKEAVLKREIEVGHAAILGQLDPKQQQQGLRIILDRQMSVSRFAQAVEWYKKVDLQNVGEHGQVIEIPQTEKQLSLKTVGENIRGDLAYSPAFKPEFLKYIHEQREKLRAKKITVFDSEEKLMKAHPKAKRIQSWDDDYVKAANSLVGSTEYGVVIDWKNGYLQKEIYRLEPKSTQKKAATTEAAREKIEEELEMTRSERLANRMREFKIQMLRKSCADRINPGEVMTKALAVHFLGEQSEAITELAKQKPKELEDCVVQLVREGIDEKLYTNDIEDVAKLLEVDLDKDFVMTKEYAEMHTKEQLADLCKEIKVTAEEGASKSALVDFLVANWPKNQAPKQLKKLKV